MLSWHFPFRFEESREVLPILLPESFVRPRAFIIIFVSLPYPSSGSFACSCPWPIWPGLSSYLSLPLANTQFLWLFQWHRFLAVYFACPSLSLSTGHHGSYCTQQSDLGCSEAIMLYLWDYLASKVCSL